VKSGTEMDQRMADRANRGGKIRRT